jgi:hypothetical protein
MEYGAHELRAGKVNACKIAPLELRLFEHASGAGIGLAGEKVGLAIRPRRSASQRNYQDDCERAAQKSGIWHGLLFRFIAQYDGMFPYAAKAQRLPR